MRSLSILVLVLVLVGSVASAQPRIVRDDLRVGELPMTVHSYRGVLWWTDAAGAVWSMPADGHQHQPVQHHEQHTGGAAMDVVGVGDELYAPIANDLLRVSDHKKLGLALPDDLIHLVSDGHVLYASLFRQPSVLRIPLDGARVTTLFSIPSGMIALAGTTLYATSYSTGRLVAYSTTTGALTTIPRRLDHPIAIVADADFVFISNEHDRTIDRVDPRTGAVRALARVGGYAPAIAEDGAWLYYVWWGAHDTGTLLRVAKDGSHPPELLADGLAAPYHVDIDAEAVYVTLRDGARILRFAKRLLPR